MTLKRETREEATGAQWVRFEPPLLLTGGGLDELIAQSLPGARAVGVDYLDEGTRNSNYRVDLVWEDSDTGRPVSVRLRLSRSDEGSRKEGALAERLGLQIPMPHLLGSATAEEPEPHRRSLFSWIEGRPLSDVLRRSRESLSAVSGSLGRALAAVHDVHPESFGSFAPDLSLVQPGGLPAHRWVDDLARRTAMRLENPAHGLQTFRCESVRTRFARLLAPLWTAPPARPSIVHGELAAGNIILKQVNGRSLEFSGLIDWETARASDPAEDIASLRFELAGICPEFVSETESAYREARGDLDLEEQRVAFERRIALASVPVLLDARMVAWRMMNPEKIATIDARLESALTPGVD